MVARSTTRNIVVNSLHDRPGLLWILAIYQPPAPSPSSYTGTWPMMDAPRFGVVFPYFPKKCPRLTEAYKLFYL